MAKGLRKRIKAINAIDWKTNSDLLVMPFLHNAGALIGGSGYKGYASEVTLPLCKEGNGYVDQKEIYRLPIFEDRLKKLLISSSNSINRQFEAAQIP